MLADDAGLFDEDIKPKVEKPVKDEEMEDLFGDAEEEDDGEKAATPTPPDSTREGSEALSASELKHRKELEYEEDEEGQEEAVVELKHAVLELPNLPLPRSSDGVNWLLKMPNFVKLDSKPFDPETYVGPDTTADGAHEREKSLSIKLEAENTIRWRWKRDESGQYTRQSNSRIIRWSDGSLSVLLGKELFDVNQTYEGAQSNSTQSQTQSQSQSQTQTQTQSQTQLQSQSSTQASAARNATTTYLVAQHKRAGILQVEAPILGQMTLRPTGMQSETHRKLARAVGQKHSRVARLRIAPDSIIEQEQQELMKTQQKKTRRPRAAGEVDELGRQGRRRRSYGRRRESVWSDEEPEGGAFADTDEEDEGGYGASPRKSKDDDRSEGKRGAGDYQTDDFLVADSDEEEEEGERRRGKKRHRHTADKEESEPDALDGLDAKIARQEEESRRRKKAAEREDATENGGVGESEAKSASDVDMEVESEEEEVSVRRKGTGSRKLAIALEDEEEE